MPEADHVEIEVEKPTAAVLRAGRIFEMIPGEKADPGARIVKQEIGHEQDPGRPIEQQGEMRTPGPRGVHGQ